MLRVILLYLNSSIKFLVFSFLLLSIVPLSAQLPGTFIFDTVKIKNWPSIHSFSCAHYEQYVLMIGGRRDGIHSKEIGFEHKNSNTNLFLWNTLNDSIITYTPDSLNEELKEYLSASNACFTQDDESLYMLGGFGQSKTGVYKTYPLFLKINLNECIQRILQSKNVSPSFKYKISDQFAVAGGQMKIMDSLFYLVGGHKFDGKYSSNNDSITQKYTDALRIFKINEQADTLEYALVKEIQNDVNFHRRDYNVSPIIMETGEIKLMNFGGVFQYNVNRAFLNTALIQHQNFEEIFDFEHKFASYNCARVGIYNSIKNEMHQIFFGGMAEYYLDSINEIGHDNYVPFVKSVSSITRKPDGKFVEYLYPEQLPGYFGSSSEFLINPELKFTYQDIVNYNSFQKDTTYLGSIFGGIYNPSTLRNVWQRDSAHLTISNPYILKVSFIKNKTSGSSQIQNSNADVILIPNPAKNQVQLKFPKEIAIISLKLSIQDTQGHKIKNLSFDSLLNNELILSTKDLTPQNYSLYLLINGKQLVKKQLSVIR